METKISKEQLISEQDIKVAEMVEDQCYKYFDDDGYCDFNMFIKHEEKVFYVPVWEGDDGSLNFFEFEGTTDGFYAAIQLKNVTDNMDISDLYYLHLELYEQYMSLYKEDPDERYEVHIMECSSRDAVNF